MNKPILNIAAYKFVKIAEDQLPDLRAVYRERTREWELKGTILLSPEGINLFIAGLPENIQNLKNLLIEREEFQGLTAENNWKESWSENLPFSRMLVKVKPQIIAFGDTNIKPEQQTAPYLSPEQFRDWYRSNKEMIILDTRNDYEMQTGTFKDAVN